MKILSLRETIQADIKEALKNKRVKKLEALRLLFSAIKNLEIKKKVAALEDKGVFSVVKRQIKQYEEAAGQFADAERPKDAEMELSKLEFLKKYLPPQLSQEELSIMVSEVIVSLKAKGLSDQGPVIKEVQKKTQGAADNVLVADLVRKQLQQI